MTGKAPLAGALLLALLPAAAQAELKVEITGGVEGGIPMAVLPFDNEPRDIKRTYSTIIASDLAYSGLFSLLPAEEVASLVRRPTDAEHYRGWAGAGVEKMVVGRVMSGGDLQIALFDIVKRRKLVELEFPVASRKPSDVAHYASDLIYEELTGVPGIFSTRLAFVSSEKAGIRSRRFHLTVADADGGNSVQIFTSSEPIMSPCSSPDYRRLAYVSYENGVPEIFIQVLGSGQRTNLSAAIGRGNSPDWSDDGGRLAFVSSRDGNPEVYVYHFNGNRIERITENLAIDTEPAWAPDGSLLFTSDRSGSPQVYRLDAHGRDPVRLTFKGGYNSDADVSPRGDKIAWVSQRPQGFSVVVRDWPDGDELELSLGLIDERPRFAPNGQLLSYLTNQGGHAALGLLTVDGVFGKLILVDAGKIRGVAWSPLVR